MFSDVECTTPVMPSGVSVSSTDYADACGDDAATAAFECPLLYDSVCDSACVNGSVSVEAASLHSRLHLQHALDERLGGG